jgi:hypothetical protein
MIPKADPPVERPRVPRPPLEAALVVASATWFAGYAAGKDGGLVDHDAIKNRCVHDLGVIEGDMRAAVQSSTEDRAPDVAADLLDRTRRLLMLVGMPDGSGGHDVVEARQVEAAELLERLAALLAHTEAQAREVARTSESLRVTKDVCVELASRCDALTQQVQDWQEQHEAMGETLAVTRRDYEARLDALTQALGEAQREK